MSEFLPDPTNPTSGILPGDATSFQSDLTSAVRLFQSAAKNPQQTLDPIMPYVLDWLQVSNFSIPITQVPGFTQFTAFNSTISSSGTTSSSTYGDLGVVGPTVSGLPDGNYVVLFGAAIKTNAGTVASRASVSVNSAAASDTDSCQTTTVQSVSVAIAVVKQLSNGGTNSIKVQYRAGGSGDVGTFGSRWLIALKYSNL